MTNFEERLVNALKNEFEAMEVEYIGDNRYEIDGIEYLVLHEDEVPGVVRDLLQNGGEIIYFNPNFLENVTGIDSRVFKALQQLNEVDQLECINNLLNVTGTDYNDIAEEAIHLDGAGNFLNRYDGEEVEIPVEDNDGETEYFYAYRAD
jgi:hypothetical protein